MLLHDRGELRTDFAPVPMTITYHAPCQQQGHSIGKPALELFDLSRSCATLEMQSTAAGSAGTYGLKKEKYEIAMDVGAELFDADPQGHAGPQRLRLRDLPLAHREGHGRGRTSTRSRSSTGRTAC